MSQVINAMHRWCQIERLSDWTCWHGRLKSHPKNTPISVCFSHVSPPIQTSRVCGCVAFSPTFSPAIVILEALVGWGEIATYTKVKPGIYWWYNLNLESLIITNLDLTPWIRVEKTICSKPYTEVTPPRTGCPGITTGEGIIAQNWSYSTCTWFLPLFWCCACPSIVSGFTQVTICVCRRQPRAASLQSPLSGGI